MQFSQRSSRFANLAVAALCLWFDVQPPPSAANDAVPAGADKALRTVGHPPLESPHVNPIAVVVRNGRLYVLAFESGNKTQLSGGAKNDIDGDLVTFDAYEHSIRNNNVLSLGHVVDILKHPRVPDRDLFVFDTATDRLVATVTPTNCSGCSTRPW